MKVAYYAVVENYLILVGEAGKTSFSLNAKKKS